MSPDAHITYDEHEQFLRREFIRTRAQLDGFIQAKSFESPLTCYSDSLTTQRIYEQSFSDGLVKLSMDRMYQEERETQP